MPVLEEIEQVILSFAPDQRPNLRRTAAPRFLPREKPNVRYGPLNLALKGFFWHYRNMVLTSREPGGGTDIRAVCRGGIGAA